LAQYNAVYQRSWKIPESHPHFIEAICHAFAEHDWLRLGLVRVNGTPIAAQIWFVKDGVASIFKLAYDEQHKVLSAGTVLSMALLRHAIDIDRVTKIDYLTGDDAYKVQYMSRCREMWCLQAYRKASLAGLFGLYESSKARLRHWLNRGEEREVADT
jgi:CelD/BcsL family acetyltransferase involved in cellulose biosynthesis